MTASPAVFERSFERFPFVFARLVGRNKVVREYRALIAPTAEYCVLPKADAFRLGYPEAAVTVTRTPSANAVAFASYTGYERGIPIKISRVDLGSLSFEDVEFLAFDILQTLGFDVILGRSLLRETRLDLDFASGSLRLERPAGVGK